MSKRPGVTFASALLAALCLLAPTRASAIAVGSLTFSLSADLPFVAKKVLNNNREARLYRVTLTAIDRPGEREVRRRPADGELLFSPRQLTLTAGDSDYFKFWYHGPQDDRERYYRIAFHEIPTGNQTVRRRGAGAVSMEPVVIIETILVVRPRRVSFAWAYDPASGSVSNTGNTWFTLLIKPGCTTSEEQGDARYLRPGDTVRQPALRAPGHHTLVYNDRFIALSDACRDP
ncbi:hypothetical protein [Pantoea sp. 1.19]|uniref:hypothetical protein n=1 Tax=Pantoea sp. 1.19 TaxID=1925589 RepID=UPI0009490EAE|nr:hypothetical protein [Pantoea sp. 1.19]